MADTVEIGPFVGGLNTASDASSIGDSDLARLVNLEVGVDGTLLARPPIYGHTLELPTGNGITLLGFFSISGVDYLIANDRANSTYAWDGASWTLITNTIAATDFAQYRDVAYLIHSSSNGGTWDGTTYTANPDIPKGNRIVLFKDRLWISRGTGATNGSRVYVSDFDSSNPILWNNDFLTVAGGDGQDVVDILPYFDTLIIFKNHSTYRFAYDTNPALGAIVLVSSSIGLIATGCAVTHEANIFTMYGDSVYDFTNFQYQRLNDKLALESNVPENEYSRPYSLSAWNNRLFVSYKGRCFVLGLRTGTWSEWVTETGICCVIPRPTDTLSPSAVIEPAAPTKWGTPEAHYNLHFWTTVPGNPTDPITWSESLFAEAEPGDVMVAHVRTNSSFIAALNGDGGVYSNGGGFTLISRFNPSPVLSYTFAKELTSDDISGGSLSLTNGQGATGWTSSHLIVAVTLVKDVDFDSIQMGSAASTNLTTPSIDRLNPNPSLSLIWAAESAFSSDEIHSPPYGWDVATESTNGTISYMASHKCLQEYTVSPGPWDATVVPAGGSGYILTYFHHVNMDVVKVPLASAYAISEAYDETEEFTCSIKTKYYDYAEPSRFKRLMWWGVDGALHTEVTATLDPAQYNVDRTWDELMDITWDDPNLHTWDRPLDASAVVVDTAEVGFEVSGRKFVRFIRSSRFRKMSFELSFSAQGPVGTTISKIFKLVTVIGQKARVPRKVN